MSKVSAIDLGLLRARLMLAIEGCGGLQGSTYLLAIGSLYLAASPESPHEIGMWSSLFEMQALTEAVDGEQLLDVLGTVTSVVAL